MLNQALSEIISNQILKPVSNTPVTKPIFSIELNTELMAETQIKISVVMPVYNADRFLEESIDSILKQTYTDFEFIIVCSNPTDETRKILTKYQESDARILITYQEKKGIIFARNFGCQQAKGEYIAVMDADDISLPDRFESQVTFLENTPEIGIVCSWADYIDEDGRVINRFHPPTKPLVIGWNLIFGNCIVHSTAMIRSDVLKKLNYYTRSENSYPEDYAEDYNLWARAFFITKIANIPKPLGKYRTHKSNYSLSVLTDLQQFCIPIQNMLIEQLLAENHHPLLKEMPAFRNSPFFSFNYQLNDIQVDIIETLYTLFVKKYLTSTSDIKEIKAHISQILLSYSWAMFHFSKSKSWNLFLKSLKYSMIVVIKKSVSVMLRKLENHTGFPPQVNWEKNID